jgi:hypothetical protein
MKILRPFALIALLGALSPVVQAGNADLIINSVSKKFEENVTVPNTGNGSISEKKEQWGYVVTIENKMFRPVAGLEAKYVVFYKQEEIGSKAAQRLQRKSGTVAIPEIAGGAKTTFRTNPVDLKKAVLNGNYYFANGAKSKAEDSLSGIWVRIYQNGALFAEYVRPSSLSSKEKWE